MKRFKEITAELATCNYCGNKTILIDEMGQCNKGCPGNFKLTAVEETIYIDLKTGQTEYIISIKQSEEEIK